MADEITISGQLRVVNGEFSSPAFEFSDTADQAAVGQVTGIQNIGFAADEVIDMGNVTNNGYAIFKNLDATNYVQVGPESGGAMVAFARIPAGKFGGPIPLEPGAVIRAQANTAAVDLQYIIFEA